MPLYYMFFKDLYESVSERSLSSPDPTVPNFLSSYDAYHVQLTLLLYKVIWRTLSTLLIDFIWNLSPLISIYVTSANLSFFLKKF